MDGSDEMDSVRRPVYDNNNYDDPSEQPQGHNEQHMEDQSGSLESQLAQGQKSRSFYEREKEWLAEREKRLLAERLAKSSVTDKECTFAPVLTRLPPTSTTSHVVAVSARESPSKGEQRFLERMTSARKIKEEVLHRAPAPGAAYTGKPTVPKEFNLSFKERSSPTKRRPVEATGKKAPEPSERPMSAGAVAMRQLRRGEGSAHPHGSSGLVSQGSFSSSTSHSSSRSPGRTASSQNLKLDQLYRHGVAKQRDRNKKNRPYSSELAGGNSNSNPNMQHHSYSSSSSASSFATNRPISSRSISPTQYASHHDISF